MKENKDLKFDKSGCLVSCAFGWDKDSEGHDGAWRTNENGEHYFIRKGESVKDAYQRFIKSKEYRQNAKYEEIVEKDKKHQAYLKIKEIGNKYFLENKEVHALHKYVNSFNDDWYVNVNKCLREGKPLSKEDAKICQNLNSALEKIPKYSGKLQRVLSLKGNALKRFLDEHVVGQIVTYLAFTSTSASKKEQVKGNVKIYIDDAQNGADIREFNTLQLEVLYKTNASFFVLAKYKIKNRYYILLKEN